NTEVKLFSADGSWGLPPVRVGRRFATQTTEESVVFLCLKTPLLMYRGIAMLILYLNREKIKIHLDVEQFYRDKLIS
ncbi:MAG: hypothetical protein ABS944_15300, partial [Solibacillus sp.]|uniref:hypothetical protein n=1 Tax=Solibacillus sp. TaxID=1909654 RepID=UPI003314C7F6